MKSLVQNELVSYIDSQVIWYSFKVIETFKLFWLDEDLVYKLLETCKLSELFRVVNDTHLQMQLLWVIRTCKLCSLVNE